VSWLSRLAERQIEKARLAGRLRGLAGEGKPLPERPGDAFVPAGDAVGFRIMAEAGALPEEIALRKAIEAERARLATIADEAARPAILASIADLELRRAIAEEARRRFLRD
jgi:hypothetical protein